MIIQENFGDKVQFGGVHASGKIMPKWPSPRYNITRWRHLTNYIFLYIIVLYIKVYIIVFLVTIMWIYTIDIYRNKIFIFSFFSSFEVHIAIIMR